MVKSISIFIAILSICVSSAFSQSHGLRFMSHEVVAEKRTSLELTAAAPLCIKDGTAISFDILLNPNLETYFGYVMRLITPAHQNIDLVFNSRNINFVTGETFSAITTVDSVKLTNRWNHFKLHFSETKHEVVLYLNGQQVGKGAIPFPQGTCAHIYFGTNNFEEFQTTDIPPFSIKDIRIEENNKTTHYYPLDELEGTTAHDETGKRPAKVRNPAWLKPRHQNWQLVHKQDIKGIPSIAFNNAGEVLYINAADTTYEYSFKTNNLRFFPLRNSHGKMPAGNQAIFDTAQQQLYNIYTDQKMVGTYDATNLTWDEVYPALELTEYWHVNKFVSPSDSSLYIVAGYGQLRYKNAVQRYHLPTKTWETVTTHGDQFTPRYMAALGMNATRDTAYILGGYGSNTGDQAINPKCYYDLLSYDVKNRVFKSIYHFKEPARQFCFANSMFIVPGTKEFYALVYPTDRFNSSLQLMKGSLEKPEYQILADSIPYAFHDIKSFADLYYSPVAKKLVAVTMHTSKDTVTTLQIHTLDFPPNVLMASPLVSNDGKPWWLYVSIGFALFCGAAFFFYRTRKAHVEDEHEHHHHHVKPAVSQLINDHDDTPGVVKEQQAEFSKVYLFGQFEVFDKAGQDITKLFTPLLRELFLILLVHTIKDGKGITSEKLYELLWSDKPVKDAKNNFSVNVVKLKAILQKIGDCHIGRESGKWKLEIIDQSFSVDYLAYVQLMQQKKPTQKAFIQAMLIIARRGAFLENIDYEWLDDTKSHIYSDVIDVMLQYMSSADIHQEAELFIQLCNSIFLFDKLNEEALQWKCKSLIQLKKHGLAKDAYTKFAKDYKETYGQEFPPTFIDLTAHE
ncbi:two-component SAPR family response regulator [Chitinophaga skermanii]|uniref:Two-component SAPR family response regulator n=1 Tax=Chitinophaga skermanii TaxID=331697 RepID=A0A327QEV3_9BACT|nr:hypothetical protein [Chitinophaga skermanii]RAJ02408.1 two-component SAPR family response regulator [Chitinophaga skermanii]